MTVRLPLLLLILVLLPLAALGWIGLRMADEEQALLEQQFQRLLLGRMEGSARATLRPLEERQRQLGRLMAGIGKSPADELREKVRLTHYLNNIFIQDKEGTLLFPPPGIPQSEREKAFLRRTEEIRNSKALFHQQPVVDAPSDNLSSYRVKTAAKPEGWYVWHWANGMNLLYWQRDAAGRIVAAELDSLGLLGDIIATLPSGEKNAQERIQLRDSRGSTLYQWGGYEPAEKEAPKASLRLSPPLDAWRLELYMDNEAALRAEGLQRFQLLASLSGMAVLLIGLGIYLYRELTRRLREASQRVGFVSQVSHELRTPLTNIRLYAELLEEAVAGDEEAERKLHVIASESQRLGRLIGNILTFARHQKGSLQIHPTIGSIDDLVRDIVEQYRPGLEGREIRPRVTANAPLSFAFDADLVCQILGNLLSNAEKYAPDCDLLIETEQREGRTSIKVQDRGDGIEPRYHEKVFAPFFRIRSDLTEGVSGTGIGLNISRELARLHGGELRIGDSDSGALFILELPMGAYEDTE